MNNLYSRPRLARSSIWLVAIASAFISLTARANDATPSDQEAAQGKTRAQVQTELAEAKRTGDLASGYSGEKLNELYPSMYPVKPPAQGKTRDGVRAELAEAIRNGDLVVGYTGKKLNELYPSRYPAQPHVAGKTREQVRAELAEAVRAGDIVVGETGQSLKDLYPSRYPFQPMAATATVQGSERQTHAQR